MDYTITNVQHSTDHLYVEFEIDGKLYWTATSPSELIDIIEEHATISNMTLAEYLTPDNEVEL